MSLKLVDMAESTTAGYGDTDSRQEIGKSNVLLSQCDRRAHGAGTHGSNNDRASRLHGRCLSQSSDRGCGDRRRDGRYGLRGSCVASTHGGDQAFLQPDGPAVMENE